MMIDGIRVIARESGLIWSTVTRAHIMSEAISIVLTGWHPLIGHIPIMGIAFGVAEFMQNQSQIIQIDGFKVIAKKALRR